MINSFDFREAGQHDTVSACRVVFAWSFQVIDK